MENHSTWLAQAAVASRGLARRIWAIGENRIDLLAVEVQEGRERLLHAVLLTVGVMALGLLAGFAFTVALTVLFWEKASVAVLLVRTGLPHLIRSGWGCCQPASILFSISSRLT